MLILDTHVLIWLDEGNPRLGTKAVQTIDRALAEEKLAVATVSFWEVGMLIKKERLEIKMEMDAWRMDLLKNGLKEIPLDGATALFAARLENFHGDPADRMIIATALRNSATLATADKRILSWEKLPRKLDATR